MNHLYAGMHSSFRGAPPYRGRGGRGRGAENILGRQGNLTLVAKNLSNDEKLYQEFMEFKKSKEGETSYAKAVTEEESSSTDGYTKNETTQEILILSDSDLKWEDQPYQILERYILNYSNTVGAYKPRLYYENLLIQSGSCEVEHFSRNNKEVYNFSKMTIKKIISIQGWGISPFKEQVFYYGDNKAPLKYNFWDYIEGFNKVLLYDNEKKKHTWWIKICSKVYNHDIPNWFIKWWMFFGSNPTILPPKLLGYFEKWSEISPQAQTSKSRIISFMKFMIEFSIPYIWKWTVFVENKDHIPYLMRSSYTKFWEKVMKEDPTTKQAYGFETLQLISTKLEEYEKLARMTQKGKTPEVENLSREQIIEHYLNKTKELAEDIEEDRRSQHSDKTMASSSSNKFQPLDEMQDAQGPLDPIPIEDILAALKENLQSKNISGK